LAIFVQNYQNWWKFDDVMTNKLACFGDTRCCERSAWSIYLCFVIVLRGNVLRYPVIDLYLSCAHTGNVFVESSV